MTTLTIPKHLESAVVRAIKRELRNYETLTEADRELWYSPLSSETSTVVVGWPQEQNNASQETAG